MRLHGVSSATASHSPKRLGCAGTGVGFTLIPILAICAATRLSASMRYGREQVQYSNSRVLPFFWRKPSEPIAQPASARICSALSGLYSEAGSSLKYQANGEMLFVPIGSTVSPRALVVISCLSVARARACLIGRTSASPNFSRSVLFLFGCCSQGKGASLPFAFQYSALGP